MFELHLNKSITPKELSHFRFPVPFLQHDQIFVDNWNNMISKWQKESMEYIISRLNEQIAILKKYIVLYKKILNNHIPNIDNYVKTCELNSSYV